MHLLQSTTLFAALTLVAGCALDLDATAIDGVAPLQFSDGARPEADQTAMVAEAQATDAAFLTGEDTQARVSTSSVFPGLFAAPASPSADSSSVSFGDKVPYGEIAAVCDAPRTGLGTKIAAVGGFEVFDSQPGSTQLRAHYITGFDDGCPRQFSAALSLTGDVGTHEVVRYMPSNRADFNATDAAYETVKASFCRARQGSPCGARLDALARTTTFITAYETFGSRPRWAEILLHDGEVKAIDFKSE